MSHSVNKDALTTALNKYNRRKLGTPIPSGSYIAEAIMLVVDGVASQAKYCRHSYLDDMKSIATLAILEAVQKRKVSGKGNAFSYFNTICKREFDNAMLMEAGEIATIQVELLGHVASNTNHDPGSTKQFIRHATKTANVRKAFIKRKRRMGSRGKRADDEHK